MMKNKDWDPFFDQQLRQPYFQKLCQTVNHAYQTKVVYPPKEHMFEIFNVVSPQQIKVVILGQDPYPQQYQAHGMSFSVPIGVTIPKSLQNIYKEIENEFHYPIPNHGNLLQWAKQGVFLLNTILTVEQGKPLSHQNFGYMEFSKQLILYLETLNQPMVYLLWGSYAQSFAQYIHHPSHLVLKTVHPSPLSSYRGFFGCNHFLKANQYLQSQNCLPIDWRITNV